MSSFLKGKFLEFSLRQVMFRCGFTSVSPDGLYIWERRPLLFINGKGAAHDADILVEPPIQMPFTYPSRILFECKAYKKDIGLTIVRNASGLRSDINDFEIVTEAFLKKRKNNHRSSLAVHERKRHLYQVGVASIFGFSKGAIEFAANNKIPLFSLQEAFRGSDLVALINSIPPDIESTLDTIQYNALKDILSDKQINLIGNNFAIREFFQHDLLENIFEELRSHLNRVHVGVLESGELIFITKDQPVASRDEERDILDNEKGANIRTRIYWEEEEPNLWTLEFPNRSANRYSFYLPNAIAQSWASFEEQKSAALDIKAERFSRIFVFGQPRNESQVPFNILTLDHSWIEDLKHRQRLNRG